MGVVQLEKKSTENHWYLERIGARGGSPAFVQSGAALSYSHLYSATTQWLDTLDSEGIGASDVVIVLGDHSPANFALVLALAIRKSIVVPLTELPATVLESRCEMACADWIIRAQPNQSQDVTGGARFERCVPPARPDMLSNFADARHSGLILFSSGSSGTPKTCLLNLDSLLETTRQERKSFVTLAFLLFDHIGGINTMINILGQGGAIVVPSDRSINTIGALIEAHGVSLLPTSPTFLKMLLMSDAASRYDLSSLQLITYGTEVMPAATLTALQRAFPAVRLKQTYGLSEIGIVPTRSKSPGSLWLEIGGEGVEYQVRDGILFLRASTAMVGYLNAPSPFDADGWLDTGDRVDVDGKYLRILGRDSELINIGGEKVHPAEVENVLLDASNIMDVTVSARPNPVTGSVLTATVNLVEAEDARALKTRLGRHCRERLEPHKVPLMFKIADAPLHSDRFKKTREPQP